MQPYSQCNNCKHLDREKSVENLFFFCEAFPAGVPSEISLNIVMHTKPYKGDHGIQFEHV